MLHNRDSFKQIASEGEQMKEAIKEVEQTQAEVLLFKLQFMGLMMASGRQEEVDQLYVDAKKLCQEMIKQGL
tara:strand:- start:725 stop:940 length:216 start_codon:yes stop_codon:yes gene_type:complete